MITNKKTFLSSVLLTTLLITNVSATREERAAAHAARIASRAALAARRARAPVAAPVTASPIPVAPQTIVAAPVPVPSESMSPLELPPAVSPPLQAPQPSVDRFEAVTAPASPLIAPISPLVLPPVVEAPVVITPELLTYLIIMHNPKEVAKQPKGSNSCGSYAVAFALTFAEEQDQDNFDFCTDIIKEPLERLTRENQFVSPENTRLRSIFPESFMLGKNVETLKLSESSDIATIAQAMASNPSACRAGFHVLLQKPGQPSGHWIFMGIQKIDGAHECIFIVPESANKNVSALYQSELKQIISDFKKAYDESLNAH